MTEEGRKQYELMQRYGESEKGNFRVIDTIPVPHPYCITARHVQHAAAGFGGILSPEAVENAEKHGASCGICKGRLKEHGTALLVECKAEIKDRANKVDPELQAYLLRIKEMAEKDNYAGFAFKKAF